MAAYRARLGLRLLSLNLPGINRNSSSLTWYKSKYSLDKLYPNSSLNFAKIPETPISSPNEKFSGFIPMDKIEVSNCRSSGPGGQNVNKVNSKVEVRFHLITANWIPEKARTKLAELQKSNTNKDGYLIIKSEKTRSQTLNLADCLDKLRCLIREAEKEPVVVPPETKNLLKARQEKAAAERLRQKRQRSFLKAGRRGDFE